MPKNRFLAYLFTCVGILITMAGLGGAVIYQDWSSWSLALVPVWMRYTLLSTLALTVVWAFIFKSKLEIPIALLSMMCVGILVRSVFLLNTPFSAVGVYLWAFISLVQITELTWGYVRRYQSIWIPVVNLFYSATLSGWSLILFPVLWGFMPREVIIRWIAMWSIYQVLFYFVYWRNAPSIITNQRFIAGTPELTPLGFITKYHDARISEMTIGETQRYIPVGIKYDRDTRQFNLVWLVRWNPGSVFTDREQVDMRWILEDFVEDVKMGGRRYTP